LQIHSRVGDAQLVQLDASWHLFAKAKARARTRTPWHSCTRTGPNVRTHACAGA
jgi:hypothetical protein